MVGQGEVGEVVEVEGGGMGFELAHEGLGGGVIDGEEGGGLGQRVVRLGWRSLP